MSTRDGPVSFVAPRAGMAKHGPWLHQMGGLSMPKRSANRLKRMKLEHEFRPITVAAMTLTTILQRFAPWANQTDIGLPAPPDVFVVDAEGHDAFMVNMVLDYVQLLDDAGRGDTETVSVIQYENKHVPKPDNARLMKRLERMGYAVTEVYVDTVAVRTAKGFGMGGVAELKQRWPPCDRGFTVERR